MAASGRHPIHHSDTLRLPLATATLTKGFIPVQFLTLRQFSAQMAHPRQLRTERPFQPFTEVKNNGFPFSRRLAFEKVAG